MSGARNEFLAAILSAQRLLEGEHLLDAPVGAQGKDLIDAKGRFARTGVAISLFSALEEFLWVRVEEISTIVNSRSLPRSLRPTKLESLARDHAPSVLTKSYSPSRRRNTVVDGYQQLAYAWLDSSATLTVPWAALAWTGSNLGAEDVLRPLEGLGLAGRWSDITRPVSYLLGSSPVKGTREEFNELAEMRHKSAHDATYDPPIVLMRNAPLIVKSIAFGFDVQITYAARQLIHQSGSFKDFPAESLIRFEGSKQSVRQCPGSYKESERATKRIKMDDLAASAIRLSNSGRWVVQVTRSASVPLRIENWWTPLD